MESGRAKKSSEWHDCRPECYSGIRCCSLSSWLLNRFVCSLVRNNQETGQGFFPARSWAKMAHTSSICETLESLGSFLQRSANAGPSMSSLSTSAASLLETVFVGTFTSASLVSQSLPAISSSNESLWSQSEVIIIIFYHVPYSSLIHALCNTKFPRNKALNCAHNNRL